VDFAVVDEDDVADVDIIDEVFVIDVDGMFFLAAFAADGEGKMLAWAEVEGDGEVAGADGGALGIHKDGDGEVCGFGGAADILGDALDSGVGGVGHIEAKDIDAGLDHLPDPFWGVGGGAECGDDFGFSHGSPVHFLGEPYLVAGEREG